MSLRRQGSLKQGFNEWSDQPYEFWRGINENRELLADKPVNMPEPRMKAMLEIVLVDASTGVIKALREICYSHR